MIGRQLGPYLVIDKLGEGGMGEVYRARDTRLDRTVAIKVLPQVSSTSSDASARFEREARAISQLSHPNICQLFDVGREGATPFLVMELLTGDTLAARLAKGPLPLETTVRYATQMANALDAAHRAGIVHRDVKPTNVMLPKTGLKLLDFGVAKQTPPTTANAATVGAPTVGGVVGTLQYMAPEVLAGRPADVRSDIWALGAVIYEMATGERVVAGATRRVTPPALDRIVRGCLAADPGDRWQSAHDVSLQLAAIAEDEVAERPTVAAARAWLPWAIAVTAVAAGGLMAWFGLRSGAPATVVLPVVKFEVPPPTGGGFADSFENDTLALSPDGTQFGFLGSDGKGNSGVFVRALSSLDARLVPGSSRALSFMWSPDGRSIAFFAEGKLKRVELPDGAPVTLCDVQEGIGIAGTWGADSILYASINGTAIYRVPASGGTPGVELKPDAALGEQRTLFPSFLPDGRRFLYSVREAGGGRIVLADPGRPPKTLVSAASSARYAAGHLIFVREGTLVAQRLDLDRGEVSGPPVSIADGVQYFYSTGVGQFSASANGTLAYQSSSGSDHLGWIDRSGRETGTVGPPGVYVSLRISADGSKVLYSRAQPKLGSYDLWSADLVRGVEQRLTSDVTSEVNAVWHPSGKWVVFAADRKGPPHLFSKDLATGEEKELQPATGLQNAQDFSPDGKDLVFFERASGSPDLWILSEGNPTRRALLQTRFAEVESRFSPDGRYLSFTTNESGRWQAFVSPYPPTGVKTLASPSSGIVPRWSRDGRELFYLTFDRRMMAVSVRTSPTLSIGPPTELFRLPGRQLWKDYDVSPDGKRFLAIISDVLASEQPMTLITNWRPEPVR